MSGLGCSRRSPLVTACMFCLLCASPSHCAASHHEAREGRTPSSTSLFYEPPPASGPPPPSHPYHTYRRGKVKRDTGSVAAPGALDTAEFVKVVLSQFGDGETLTRENFSKLLSSLGLESTPHPVPNHAHEDSSTLKNHSHHIENPECVTGEEMFGEGSTLSADQYLKLCPVLLAQLVPTPDGISRCAHSHSDHSHQSVSSNQTAVWVYSTISVVLISLCGLLAVAVIPLMHKALYHQLLQYLVALAVGTLCGDALLHLLPHAMMSSHAHHDHDSPHETAEDQHSTNLYRGLAAALSLVFFCFTEKCLSILGKLRKTRSQKHEVKTKVRVMRDGGVKPAGERENCQESGNPSTRVGEKLCKHKYSSYPYCYGEIDNNTHGHNHGEGENEAIDIKPDINEDGVDQVAVKNMLNEVDGAGREVDAGEKELLAGGGVHAGEAYTTIILREHHQSHHGHAHTHGHVHSAPSSLSSVAWMVVMGDGLHNFTDGLAIGAAFAANIGGGVSTAVAVFCHELPHELGDFAVLLKAGMSAKQAVFYNMLSSVLCLIGMCIGVLLGHNDTTTLWVFSGAAGMFLYIALVDLMPELSSGHSEKGTLCQCILQLGGILTGIGIMLVIALYEHNLKEAFKDNF